jgi:integrase
LTRAGVMPLLELARGASTSVLRSALAYLAVYKVEIHIAPPPDHKCTVFRHVPPSEPSAAAHRGNPESVWAPLETRWGRDFPHVTIPQATVDAAVANTQSDRFVVRCVEVKNGEQPLLLSFEEAITASFHQLLVGHSLPKHIVRGLRQFLHDSVVVSNIPAHTTRSAAPPSELLSKEIDTFCEVKTTPIGRDKRNRAWTHKTLTENRAIFDDFIEIVGNKPVLALTNADYDAYLSALKVLPPNKDKASRTRGLSIKEILALPRNVHTPVLSAPTVKKYASRVAQLLDWLLNRYPTVNVSLRKSLAAGKSKRIDLKTSRLPFSDTALMLMFESEKSLTYLAKRRHGYHVWLPPLGLCTGARLNELCSLRLTDIGQEGSSAFIDINETDDENKNIKTGNSVRRIPMHPALIELGFLAFVERRRERDVRETQGRLFPECKYTEGHGHIKAATYWFNRLYLPHLGLKTPRTVFHSFRHTVSGRLNRSDLKRWRICRFLGHAGDAELSESERSYMNDVKPDDLLPVLDVLQFSIDWSGYKKLCDRT